MGGGDSGGGDGSGGDGGDSGGGSSQGQVVAGSNRAEAVVSNAAESGTTRNTSPGAPISHTSTGGEGSAGRGSRKRQLPPSRSVQQGEH
jgi:hypothetical protein